MGREVGGGIGMGKTCEPKAFSFQCMTKFTTNKKKKELASVVMLSQLPFSQLLACSQQFVLSSVHRSSQNTHLTHTSLIGMKAMCLI